MSPQWMPQNIQKRLLLYVLQQLSLFSEIDLPNLEEVSLNNIVLKNVSIDPDKVGKLPGCNLRYGQVGSLELNGGVMGGVSIDANNVEIVIAPDFDMKEEISNNVQFLLAQSTADLANTLMVDKSSNENESSDDETDTVMPSVSSKSRSNSSSSGTSARTRPSALSGVMTKAVEMALLRLQVKVTNLNIKIVSESTDLVLKVDEALLNTINGTRHVKIKGVKLITLKPEVNPGESSDDSPEQESPKESENSNTSDDDEDNDNDYGDESLMNSMVFTHDEASSIYMSATSQSFNKPSNNDDTAPTETAPDNKESPILLHIDDIDIEFEGLSNITNLEIDVGEIKVAAVPITPTIISIFNNISHNLKLKYYQQRKLNIHKQRFKSNLSFPQYADDNDEIEDENEQMPILDDNGASSGPFFDKLRIHNIIVSATSALLPTGQFASASNSLNFIFHNLNIKYKSEALIYGGIEVFKIVKITNDQEIEVLKFNNSTAPTNTEPKPSDEPAGSTSAPSNSSKADIRFEVFTRLDNEIKHLEFTSLFSKQAFVNLDKSVLLLLSNFGISVSSIYDSYNTMRSTMNSVNLFKANTNINGEPRDASSIGVAKESNLQIILQTASTTINIKLSDNLNLKAVIYPISFNLLKQGMSINKILISTVSSGIETLISTLSNIQLSTKSQEFKSFSNKSGYSKGSNDSFPRETILGSNLTLSLSKISSKASLKELKLLIGDFADFASSWQLLSLQVNSLKNSVKDKGFVMSSKSNKNESSSMLLNSMYFNQRRSRRSNFNNPSLVNTNRSNLVSFRLYVDHIEFCITNVLPKLGDFDFQLEKVSFYKLNNDIQGSIHTVKVDRNLGNGEAVNDFIYEFQRKRCNKINIPLILVNIKSNDKANTIDISLRNFLIEYYTRWLELLEKEIDENAVLHDITGQKRESSSLNSPSKRLDIRFSLYDCVIGLNPGRLDCKSLLIINKGNSDVTFGLHQFYIKSSLRNLSLLIIDDVKNINLSKTDREAASKPTSTAYISPLSWFTSIGYISVGNINCIHLGITVNTGIQEIIERNEKLGLQDNLALLDIKINSDEHQLDLCADSAHVLIQMINDLKPPLSFTDEEKIKVTVNDPINLLDEIGQNVFLNESIMKSASHSETFENLTISRKNSDANDINIVEEYYDGSHTSSQSLENGFNKLSISESDNTKDDASSFSFDEEHFSSNGADRNNTEVFPIKMNINLSKTKIYLYDGFDWKGTRKTIKGAVKRVEAQALQELERVKEHGSRKHLKRNMQVTFDEPESNATEDNYGNDQENDDGNSSDNQLLIGETLFQSIHLSVPKGSNPSSLTKNINKSVQNYFDNEDSNDLSINYNVETGRNYKNLKLRRSKNHKISIDLKNIEVNMAILTTRDPRRDKDVPDVKYEVTNSIDLRIEDIDIYDNIPNSTWNKFLSYMNSLGEREIGTSMLKASITNVRPNPELCSTEAMIDISILPIRLHVDQDALDFFIRFFDFKDKRFELPIDEIIYIQMFKMSSIKLKLDYKPKKIDYSGIRSGKVSEFVNFFILDGSELSLPKLTLYGILGMPMLGAELTKTWAPNIQQTQLSGLLAGLSPFRSIVNIGGGFKDLVAVPIKEYRKDGRLIRSLQKGTSKFAKTTGYELLNLGAKLASGTQVVLEQSEQVFGGEGSSARSPKNKNDKHGKIEDDDNEDIYTSGNTSKGNSNLLASSQLLNKTIAVDNDPYGKKKLYSYIELDESDDIDDKILENSLLLMNPKDIKESRQLQVVSEESELQELDEKEELDDEDAIKLVSLYSNQPENTQQGLKLAYKSLGENFKITKKAVNNLRKELNASSNVQESLKSMVKSSPILIIRPMIGTTEALLKALMGISNEIDSNHIIESKDKYRYDASEK